MNNSDSEGHNDSINEQSSHVETLHASTSIGEEVALFIKQIDSLAETLPLTMVAIRFGYEQAHKKYKEFVEKYCDMETNGDSESVRVPTDYLGRHRRLVSPVEKFLLAYEAVPRSFIVSLVSSYDAFLGGLIRNLFLMKPDALSASDKNLTFSELVEFGSIEDAREYIVEKEVETVLRKSHSEQFDWLENKFGLPLRKGLEIWPSFVEVTERRNLFVHNRGVVSNHYLDICRKHNVEFETKPQVGEQLSVPIEYFNSAFETIFEMGVKLAHVLWRKVQPGDLEEADDNLIMVGYNLLSEERFDLARRVLDFSTTTLKTFSSEQNRLMLVVNQAQAYKWSDDMEKTRKILSEEDWSTRSDDFQLAEAVLLDDFNKAGEIVKRIGTSGSVGKNAYREWPLFRAYRKSEQLQSVFEEVFQDPLNLFSVKSQETEGLSEDEPLSEDEAFFDDGPFFDEPFFDNNSFFEKDPFFEDEQLLEDNRFLEDELPPIDEQ